MSLTRLVLLGLIAYILYRLIFARPKQAGPGQATDSRHDVLVEDPICHTYVPESQAVTLKHQGTILHFCSEKCRDEFKHRQ
jgi:YHS domain-containing protein